MSLPSLSDRDALLAALDEFKATVALSMQDMAGGLLGAYIPRPHTDHLMHTLEAALTRAEGGEDVRIVVEMPPGQGKSTVCSILFPLYALARHPDWEVILVSGEASLATKWARDCRRHITDGAVPNLALSPQSRAATEWETTHHGSLIARGVGGMITGRRARVMVIDDPTKNLTEAHSRVHREMLWDTWQSVLKTRLRPGSVCVLVQTRWHADDLAGRLLEHNGGDWEEVRYQAINEAGEPLLSPQTPETPDAALVRWEKTRTEVGSYVWSALYQQQPVPTSGSIFDPDWWGHWDTPPNPDDGTTLTSWDLAFGDTGDYCVGQVWQFTDGTYYLIDQVRGRWPFTEQVRQIQGLAARYPQASAHVVEKAANGFAAVDTLTKTLPGVLAIPARGSKEVRAHAVAPMVEAGQVMIPKHAPWLTDFITEVTGFPSGAPHDDQVDALTQGLSRLRHVGRGGVVDVNPAVSSPVTMKSVRRGGGGW